MNVRLLKAKRVENGLLQKELAATLNITEKAMCHKECSSECKFKVSEIIKLTKRLGLSLAEVDAIFFDSELTECISKTKKVTNEETG